MITFENFQQVNFGVFCFKGKKATYTYQNIDSWNMAGTHAEKLNSNCLIIGDKPLPVKDINEALSFVNQNEGNQCKEIAVPTEDNKKTHQPPCPLHKFHYDLGSGADIPECICLDAKDKRILELEMFIEARGYDIPKERK